MRSGVTTHVLDIARGCPAVGITALLQHKSADVWVDIGYGVTNQTGRIDDLGADGALEPGRYRLTFETAAYFERTGSAGFYPKVRIEFEITQPEQHYHLPLLLSPFGYSTYRGY